MFLFCIVGQTEGPTVAVIMGHTKKEEKKCKNSSSYINLTGLTLSLSLSLYMGK